MGKRIALTGDEAAAYAMKQIEPDVVAAYPITPQTEIVMNFAQYVADGEVGTEMIPVESEHSAMSACVGSAAAGARTMTATAANGLALMWEVLYIAASTRLPIVMSVVNRALSAPINIHCDHSDSMGARESGWIQMYCENAQEVYESLILAMRIAEHPDILLPVMVCQDGFITSHAVEAVETFDDEQVKEFLGEHEVEHSLLDVDDPVTYGPLDLYDYYFEHKRQQAEAMLQARRRIPEVCAEFEKAFGRRHRMVETHRLEDAGYAVVCLGSTAGTAKTVVDGLRAEGREVELVKPRFIQPFPAAELQESLRRLDAVGVLDRSETFSTQGGPLYQEIRSALFDLCKLDRSLLITSYIYGLGGREIDPPMIREVFRELAEPPSAEKVARELHYVGVRE
jgi:pyruvate ferredoxin oxidoreductase alpha subunit